VKENLRFELKLLFGKMAYLFILIKTSDPKNMVESKWKI